MSRFGVIALVACLLISVVSAGTTCVGLADTVKKGQVCGNGASSCTFGYYCADDGTCQPSLAAGAACLYNSDCQFGARCQGPPGAMVCVNFAGPGSACTTNATLTSPPFCGAPYTCDPIQNICLGGMIGDNCMVSNGTDPCSLGLKCTSGVCAPVIDGANCTSPISTCGPLSFCDMSVSPNVCTPRKTQGICSGSIPCASGFTCTRSSTSDTYECIPNYSRASGKFCDTDLACASPNRCVNNHCAAGTTQYCQSQSQCSDYQVCMCNGLFVDSGIGQCMNNPCWGVEQAYAQCINQNCFSCSSETCTDYPVNGWTGQCVMNKCLSQWKAKIACDSAAGLATSVFFATLLAFFVHFTSKKI